MKAFLCGGAILSARQVFVCTSGECNGECYACRLRSTEKERVEWERIARQLFERHILRGTWGPWSDDWDQAYSDRLWTDEGGAK